MSKYNILIKNISLNFITNGLILILSVISVPIFINKLGYEQFGLYLLFNIFIGYANYINNGTLTALTKYLVLFKKNKSDFISSGLVVNSILGVIIPFLYIFFGFIFMIATKNISQKLFEIYQTSLILSAISIPFLYLGDVFWTYPFSLQKFEVSNIKDLITGGLQIIGGLVIVLTGGNVISLQIFRIFIHLLYMLFFLAIYYKYFEQRIEKISVEAIHKIINYAKFKFITDLSGQFIFQSDKLIFSFANPISYLPYYAVPVSVIQRLSFFISNFVSAIFPFLINIRESMTINIKKYYLKINKGLNVLNILILIFVFINAKEIMNLLVGEVFAIQTYLIMRIISISYLIFNFAAIPTIMFESVEKPKIPSIFSLSTSILLSILYIIFVPLNNIYGVPFSLLLSSLIMVPLFLIFTYKSFNLFSIKNLMINIIYPLLIVTIINTLLHFAVHQTTIRLVLLANLFLVFLISLILNLFAFYIFGIVNKSDINKVKTIYTSFLNNKRLHNKI